MLLKRLQVELVYIQYRVSLLNCSYPQLNYLLSLQYYYNIRTYVCEVFLITNKKIVERFWNTNTIDLVIRYKQSNI